MKIQTFSIVVGSKACDAHCPFCVSHTTGFAEVENLKRDNINLTNLWKATDLARMAGCTTLLFTGKGEPTLYPEQITRYLQLLQVQQQEWSQRPWSTGRTVFPLVELQTNAIRIGQGELDSYRDSAVTVVDCLNDWRVLGLNTIAISVVDVRTESNKRIYLHHRDIEYPDLAATIKKLHHYQFSVRLCLMMHKGIVDNPDRLVEVLNFCKENGVAQLTVRPIRKPESAAEGSAEFIRYITEYGLDEDQIATVRHWVDTNATHILTLMNGAHQAKVYDFQGQNICLSDCLTVEPTGDDIRTMIFYPDGKLYFDWQYHGARLL